jgi:hypothetical protein
MLKILRKLTCFYSKVVNVHESGICFGYRKGKGVLNSACRKSEHRLKITRKWCASGSTGSLAGPLLLGMSNAMRSHLATIPIS